MQVRTSFANVAIGMSAMAWIGSALAQLPEGSAAHFLQGQTECRPEYPAAAMRANAQGTTRLLIHVDTTGKPTQVDIVESSGPKHENKLLDRAAAKAFMSCAFVAAVDEKGNAIEGVTPVNYTWAIR